VTPDSRRVLVLLSTAELLAMSLWFTGTAALPQLAKAWSAGYGLTAWLTIAVQLGFVAGALVAAVFNLPDVFRPGRIFVVSSLAAAAANALFAWVAAEHIATALVLRFLTGAFLAGVYPTGMKLLAGWFREGRGLALGIFIAALTVGSALPHAVEAAGNLPWRAMVLASSGFAVLAALLVALGVHEGPYAAPQPPFDFHQVGQTFRQRRLRLVNLGYLGHMWEVYSMWGWIGVLLAASGTSIATAWVEMSTFSAIAIGAVGCVWAGVVSDRAGSNCVAQEPAHVFKPSVASPELAEGEAEGSPAVQDESARLRRRSNVTIVAMAVSGACCLAAGLVFDSFPALVAVSLVWGIAVVADSAQFSTIVSEVSHPSYVGTALTMQVALGFLLTSVSVRVVAAVGGNWGWRWAGPAMAIGPLLGILAMMRLRTAPAD
jgi:MFS family permease